MKLVYEANQLGEAHIIKHLLERAGLQTTILGEYLQGGVGEIAASGLLKVMVNEAAYDEAKSIIQAWDEAEWDEDAWKNESL
ncbi:MAG: DUF2007 domain-containing protein [Ghiorsea sp.]|nr:DUF2007 domain-containing protein [Ghiorsea sp.]